MPLHVANIGCEEAGYVKARLADFSINGLGELRYIFTWVDGKAVVLQPLVAMVARHDIALSVYLRQTTGERLGVIAVVHQVGTSWSGEWFFQLRYLSRPVGVSKRASSEWSSNLREKDLVHFELIGAWITAQALLAGGSPSLKPKKLPRVPAWMRGIGQPNQLRLFDDF